MMFRNLLLFYLSLLFLPLAFSLAYDDIKIQAQIYHELNDCSEENDQDCSSDVPSPYHEEKEVILKFNEKYNEWRGEIKSVLHYQNHTYECMINIYKINQNFDLYFINILLESSADKKQSQSSLSIPSLDYMHFEHQNTLTRPHQRNFLHFCRFQ